VPASEVSLLVLLESVLSPIWAWLFLSETIEARELIGGAMVLAAVATMILAGQRRVKANSSGTTPNKSEKRKFKQG
jgi:drug/metabolite transporter, DME family